MTPAPARPQIPEIVAHRGDAEHFPENTLPALEAAWAGGLRHAEFDVQLSADGVPYVIHDAGLERTTHAHGDLRLMPSGQLDGIDAGEPSRFGHRHDGTRLPRLTAVAELLSEHRSAYAFVEIKRASLVHHGTALCIERICAALAPVIERCTVISFDVEACRIARATHGLPIGWVLDAEPDSLQQALDELHPDYVFCDLRRLPAGRPVPRGNARWVAYEVTDAGQAFDLFRRGVAMVESMAPLSLQAALSAATGVTA